MLFWDRVSLCSLGWPPNQGTFSASGSRELRLQMWAPIPSQSLISIFEHKSIKGVVGWDCEQETVMFFEKHSQILSKASVERLLHLFLYCNQAVIYIVIDLKLCYVLVFTLGEYNFSKNSIVCKDLWVRYFIVLILL